MQKEDDMRSELDLMGSVKAAIAGMSEGNPGAIRVLTELMERDATTILHLDDMNIRGTQIWIAYSDHCGKDIEKFHTAIITRDSAMIEAVNAAGLRGNHTERAVRQGASSHRPTPLAETRGGNQP
jgi:hypothetical protein